VYVTNGDARNDVRFEGQRSPCGSPTSVVGHLSEARITVLDPVSGSVTPRHLNKHLDSGRTATARSPAPPHGRREPLDTLGMAVTGDGSTLYVAAFGSSDPASRDRRQVGVFATAQLEANTFTPSLASHILLSGGGASASSSRGETAALRPHTLRQRGIRRRHVTSPATSPAPADLQPEPAAVTDGRQFLYTPPSPRATRGSCASCHIFGDLDSLAWDLGDRVAPCSTTEPLSADHRREQELPFVEGR